MGEINSVSNSEIVLRWAENYKTAPEQLKKMAEVNGLISAFNANIDAVIKISGKDISELISRFSLNESNLVQEGKRQIHTIEDAVRGIIHCFKSGIAEEWLVENETVYKWLNQEIGYDKLQMGGQGGIVANVMAVCGVNPVYVHCASLPSIQANLFIDRKNLLTVDQTGKISKAHSIDRQEDIPLIHWIIEFDKGDTLSLAGTTLICPKSNRFIATYDPLNFKLYIDHHFARVLAKNSNASEIIILSGYQMLKDNLNDGSKGSHRIDESLKIIDNWRSDHKKQIVHLEMASTQDRAMRKYLLDTLANKVDSLGFNERELIDLLEVMGEKDLLHKCEEEPNSINLFEGMERLFKYTNASRLQLHMFGLYLTMQSKNFTISPKQNKDGMQLAALIAAAKAGTGAIDNEEILLWATNQSVSEQGINELRNLSLHIKDKYLQNELLTVGIWENESYDLIAVPTILIDKPITLVGMGDTISSISLVAAR